jgi:hypothetical protein
MWSEHALSPYPGLRMRICHHPPDAPPPKPDVPLVSRPYLSLLRDSEVLPVGRELDVADLAGALEPHAVQHRAALQVHQQQVASLAREGGELDKSGACLDHIRFIKAAWEVSWLAMQSCSLHEADH